MDKCKLDKTYKLRREGDLSELFPENLEKFVIHLRKSDIDFLELKGLVWCLIESEIENITIVLDPLFYFESNIYEKNTFDYIAAVSLFLKYLNYSKITLRYYYFDFNFNDKGEIIGSNFTEKMFEFIPATILASVDFRSSIERLNMHICDQQLLSVEECLFLKNSLAILESISGFLEHKKESELLSHPDSSNNLRYLCNLNIQSNFDHGSKYICIYTVDQPEHINFIYIQNWQKIPNHRLENIKHSKSCFISVTQTYFYVLLSRTFNESLKLLKNDFFIENDNDCRQNPYFCPYSYFIRFKLTADKVHGQCFIQSILIVPKKEIVSAY